MSYRYFFDVVLSCSEIHGSRRVEELDELLRLLEKISENYEKSSDEYVALKKAGLAF